MPQTSDRTVIAKITRAHGIKGHIKLTPYTDEPEIIETAGAVFMAESGGSPISIKITGRTQKHLLAKIEGIDDRNAAEELQGNELWINKDALPARDPDTFYTDDLIDLKAIDKDGAPVGTVIGVENFGAGDLLDIKPADGGDSFYMIFSEDNVLDVDLEKGVVTVDVPELI